MERGGLRSRSTGVEYDSRRVGRGDVFVAMRGGAADGNRYIDAAIAQGAAAVVTDSREAYERLRREHAAIAAALVERGRRALAEVSAAVMGHPERKLALSAVTGTNGKTTTAFLLEPMLRSVGRKCVLIGTIETHVGDEVRVSPHTTPESRGCAGDICGWSEGGGDRGGDGDVSRMRWSRSGFGGCRWMWRCLRI